MTAAVAALPDASPEISLQVSETLRALVRGWRGAAGVPVGGDGSQAAAHGDRADEAGPHAATAPVGAAAGDEHASEMQPAGVASAPGRAPDAPRWPEIVLRQDARRPMRFPGLALWRQTIVSQTPVGPLRQGLAIFLAAGGAVVATWVALPPPGAATLPVYRCAPVSSATGLRSLLSGWRAALSPLAPPGDGPAPLAAAEAALAALTAACLAADPLHTQRNTP